MASFRFGFVGFVLSNFFSCNWWWNSTTERLMASVLTDWEIDIVLDNIHLGFGELSAAPLKAPLWSTSTTANCPPPPMVVTGDSMQHLYLGKKEVWIWFSVLKSIWFSVEVPSLLFAKMWCSTSLLEGIKVAFYVTSRPNLFSCKIWAYIKVKLINANLLLSKTKSEKLHIKD